LFAHYSPELIEDPNGLEAPPDFRLAPYYYPLLEPADRAYKSTWRVPGASYVMF